MPSLEGLFFSVYLAAVVGVSLYVLSLVARLVKAVERIAQASDARSRSVPPAAR